MNEKFIGLACPYRIIRNVNTGITAIRKDIAVMNHDIYLEPEDLRQGACLMGH